MIDSTPTGQPRESGADRLHAEIQSWDGYLHPAAIDKLRDYAKSLETRLSASEARGKELERAENVCKELDHFQKEYDKNTSGCGMPGNDFYSKELMRIVLKARAALAAHQREGEP